MNGFIGSVAWYILGILALVVFICAKMFDQNEKGKNELLDEMFKNNDISGEIYKKYKK